MDHKQIEEMINDEEAYFSPSYLVMANGDEVLCLTAFDDGVYLVFDPIVLVHVQQDDNMVTVGRKWLTHSNDRVIMVQGHHVMVDTNMDDDTIDAYENTRRSVYMELGDEKSEEVSSGLVPEVEQSFIKKGPTFH